MITQRSPLHQWMTLEGRLSGLDAELTATVEGTIYAGGPCFTQRVYRARDIVWGYNFVNIVTPPADSETGFLDVDWSNFHTIEAAANTSIPSSFEKLHEAERLEQSTAPQLKRPAGSAKRSFYSEELEDVMETHMRERGDNESELGESDAPGDERGRDAHGSDNERDEEINFS